MPRKEDIFRYLYQGTFAIPHVQDAGSSISSIFNQSATFYTFFNGLFKAAIIAGALLAVIRLGYGGIVYMTTELMPSKQSARKIIADAVLGLLLLLSIWVILNQINPDILNLDITRSVRSAQGQQSGPGAFAPFCPQGQVWTGTGCSKGWCHTGPLYTGTTCGYATEAECKAGAIYGGLVTLGWCSQQ